MENITENKAIEEFNNGNEVWVYTGDYGDMPLFEYEEDEDGDEIVDDAHKLMHPKSLDMGDEVKDLEGYNNFYISK
tara:strand:- start:288 stop:515 length:228 start_codon:yes stop_codon:yes gene_type:complete